MDRSSSSLSDDVLQTRLDGAEIVSTRFDLPRAVQNFSHVLLLLAGLLKSRICSAQKSVDRAGSGLSTNHHGRSIWLMIGAESGLPAAFDLALPWMAAKGACEGYGRHLALSRHVLLVYAAHAIAGVEHRWDVSQNGVPGVLGAGQDVCKADRASARPAGLDRARTGLAVDDHDSSITRATSAAAREAE